jgi:hypothetical protein
MVHRFAVIAIIGLTASAVCMGAAATMGGGSLGDAMDFSMFDGSARCEAATGGAAASRDLDWDGSTHAGLAIHAVANYAPGGSDKVHATGDPQILAHLRVRNGMIELDCHGWRDRETDVTITLPGRAFEKFILTGTGKMNLDRLNQDTLKIQMAGVGSIKANGKVNDLAIDMAGVGKADFAQVTGRKATVKMAGVNKADIAPTDDADIEIAGPSEVTLHSNPPHLDTKIFGPGRVRKVGPGS